MIFVGDVPWIPRSVASSSEYGPGTQYPIDLGIFGAWQLYWLARRFSIAGSVSGLIADSVPFDGQFAATPGVARAARARDLVFPQGGTAEVSNGGDIGGSFQWSAELQFTLEAESIRPGSSREHYLKLGITGYVAGSGSGVSQLSHITTAGVGTGVGTVYIQTGPNGETTSIPLYSGADPTNSPPGDIVQAINLQVTWDTWGAGEL